MYLKRVFTNKNTSFFRKGLEAGLSKQQISNVFNSQEALGNISPVIAIETSGGVRNGKVRADFYNNCQDIPDPSALEPMQKNMLLLDDCFLCKQNNKTQQLRYDIHCIKLFPITSTHN